MGNYNPYAPVLLGQEWVPIRDENLAFSPVINSVERGTSYRQAASSQLRDARFYVHQAPADAVNYQVAQVNLYPYGLESDTGPIQQVLIPTKAVTSTGTGIALVGASTLTEALYQPGDAKYVTFNYTGLGQTLSFWFDILAYPVLANKRILNVSLAYAGSVQDAGVAGSTSKAIDFVHPDDGSTLTVLSQLNDLGSGQQFLAPAIANNTGTLSELNTVVGRNGTARDDMTVAYVDLGDINNCWNTAALGVTGGEKLPWRYVDLLRFEPSFATIDRQQMQLSVGIPLTENGFPAGTGNDVLMTLDYIALRVIYCEERRIAYGGQQYGYSYGMNKVTMRDLTQTADPTIAAGAYTPTLSFVSPGQVGFGGNLTSDFPEINADRQLYQIPSHPGVELDIPFPLAERIGETFTQQPSAILPQLSLHSSGGPLVDPHVYGRQAAAQVWGVQTATQEIYDDISGVAASYPQVRYYARRFGDTTIPLTLTGTGVFTGSTVSITADTFDDLPEILDGWREVTLRFTNAPSMGAATGTPGWMWSAYNEYAGNRWEVLAASAPAISGVPGSLYTQVPAPNQLGTATYQPPAGSTVELTWMPQGVASTWVTGTTIDAATDAVLIFSQDPATITGLGIAQLTQAVSGIGALCGSIPCCIPSGIGYHQITWPMIGQTTLVRDAFTRTVVAGLGSPDVGTGPYVLTDIAAAYAVNGSEALITPSAAGPATTAHATLDVGSPNFDITMQTGSANTIVAGSNARTYAVGRFTDANNWYGGLIQQTQSTSATVIAITKTVAGAETVLLAPSSPLNIDAGGRVWVRFMGTTVGTNVLLKFKIWRGELEDQPAFWNIETTDTSLLTGNRAGFAAQSRGVVGDVLAFDNLLITPPAYWFGGYELQRFDSLAGDFQTIMAAIDVTTTTFNDYEARVGVASVYRIRQLNAMNFAGLWSTYVSGTQAAPGVTGPGTCDMTGALIFTANGDQTGNNNAAYVMQWDGTPNEAFDLPEAGQVQFQPMYGRDGSVAFHGTERGLEEFDRTVLLQAGAISLPSLADAVDIRDLAWDELPYVCVRDGRGNRWFSNVRVPQASARNNAQNYMARIAITETTRTPYPVDP
jgi:hypothetical protein